MTSAAKQQQIYEASYGSLKALQFATADEVQAKVEQIRDEFGYAQKERDMLTGLLAFDFSDLAADEFEVIYSINPYYLMEILGN